MPDIETEALTRKVVDSFSGAPDARTRTVLQAFVRHAHAFVKEVKLTEAEWWATVGFLTRTGQICDDRRQEFILLSDVLGISMLVDAINNSGAEGTPSTVLGPFYVEGPPALPAGSDISKGEPGTPLYVDVHIQGADNEPIAGATVDVWQSDTDGFYDVQRPELDEPTLRARFTSDDDGKIQFWSILPSPYPIPHDGPVGELLKATGRHPWRPAHLHFMIAAPGRQRLVTHLFVEGDAYLQSDAVFGVKQALVHAFPAAVQTPKPPGGPGGTDWRILEFAFQLRTEIGPKISG